MRTNTQLTAAIRQIDDWIDPNGVSAAVISVRYQGAEIASHAAGMLKNGMPVREDTLFGLASVTKPITAAGVLALVDDGLVSLDEPVVRFLPEFGTPAADGNPEREAGRGLITVRQLLSHTSGLPEDLSSGVLPLRNQPTLTEISDAMMHAPLQFDPGTALRYSNCGYGVLGRLIERVTGEDIWAFVQSRILGPMNLQDIHARPNIAAYDRIATVLDVRNSGTRHESYNSPYWRDLAIPWGGLYGTAENVARFADCFLPGAEAVLSSAAREAMTTDQANGVAGGLQMLRLTWHPAFWGLGWEIKGTKRRHWTGDYTSPATYCHWGAAGTLVWTDPTRALTVAVFGNRTSYNGWPFMPIARWARISNAIVAAVS